MIKRLASLFLACFVFLTPAALPAQGQGATFETLLLDQRRGVPAALAEFAPWAAYGYVTSGQLTPQYYNMALAETRAGSALMLNAAGEYQSIGANLPLILGSAGHDVYQGYGIQNYSSADFSAASAWSSASSFDPSVRASIISGQNAYRMKGNNTGNQGISQSRTLDAAGVIRVVMIVENINALKTDIGLAVASPFSWLLLGGYSWTTGILSFGLGVASNLQVIDLGTGPNGGPMVLFTATVDTGATTAVQMLSYPTNGAIANTREIIVHYYAWQHPALPLMPPIVSPNNAKASRPPSISTITGQPVVAEPRIKLRATIPDLTDRTFYARGPDTDNELRLSMVDGKIRLTITVGGVVEVLIETDAYSSAPGEINILAVAKNGAQSIDATGRTGATASVAVDIPDQTNEHFGGLGLTTFPNVRLRNFAVGSAR